MYEVFILPLDEVYCLMRSGFVTRHAEYFLLYTENVSDKFDETTCKAHGRKQDGVTEVVVLGPCKHLDRDCFGDTTTPHLLHVLGRAAVDRDRLLEVAGVTAADRHRTPHEGRVVRQPGKVVQVKLEAMVYLRPSWVLAQRPVRKTSSRLMKGVLMVHL